MKAAVLFSGHTRNWDKCIDLFFKNVNDPLIDYGFSVDRYMFSFSERFPLQSSSIVGGSQEKNDFSLLENRYCLVKYSHEPYSHEKFLLKNFYFGNKSIEEVLFLWYGVHTYDVHKFHSYGTIYCIPSLYQNLKAFELIEGYYDIIIRMRPDILMHEKLRFEFVERCLIDKNSVCAAVDRDIHNNVISDETHFGLSDHFVVGSHESVWKYCNVYNLLGQIFNIENIFYPPERVLGKGCKIQGLQFIDYSQNYEVSR